MKKLSAVKLVKEMSRERIGQVRTVQTVPNRRRELLVKANGWESLEQFEKEFAITRKEVIGRFYCTIRSSIFFLDEEPLDRADVQSRISHDIWRNKENDQNS